MIYIFYNKDEFDSSLSSQILANYCSNNDLNCVIKEFNDIKAFIEDNMDKFVDNTNDYYYIFGYRQHLPLITLLSTLKTHNYDNVKLFECISYYKNLILKNKNIKHSWLSISTNQSMALNLYNILYNPINIIETNNVLKEISNVIMYNYNLNDEVDIIAKYNIIVDKFNNANSKKDFVNEMLSDSPVLYTADELIAEQNKINSKTYNSGYIKNNVFVINSSENILISNLENNIDNYDKVMIFTRIGDNENFIKLYNCDTEIDYTAYIISDFTDFEEDVQYAINITDTNIWYKIVKSNGKTYKILTLNNGFEEKKLVNLSDKEYTVYDASIMDLLEKNSFNVKDNLTNKFGNVNGSKNIGVSIINDEQLFNILKTLVF